MKNSFKTIPPRSEITPDVETFRIIESDFFINKSYLCDGIIILPDGTKINAIISYKLVDDGYDTTYRPVEYKERS